MTMTLQEFEKQHPTNRKLIDAHKQKILAEIHMYRLRELRKNAGLSQQQVADIVGVSQRQISKIERGAIEQTRLHTIRKYCEAVGATLTVDATIGTTKMQIA